MSWKKFKNFMKGFTHKSEFKFSAPDEIMRRSQIEKAIEAHVLRSRIVGAGAGGAVGATIGALSGKKLTPEQEKKNEEIEDWWEGLTEKEKNLRKNIEHFDRNYVHGRLERGLFGLAVGATLGGYGANSVARIKAQKATDNYNDLIQKSLGKDSTGKYHMPGPAFEDILDKAKDVVDNNEEPFIFTGYGGRVQKGNRKSTYAKILRDKAYGYGSYVSVSDLPEIEALKAELLSDFMKSYQGKNISSNTSNIVERLKAEGISTHKQFARKYHPDVNSSIPKDVEENYSEILDVLRGDKPASKMTAMDNLVNRFRSENNERIIKARDSVKKYTERYHKD